MNDKKVAFNTTLKASADRLSTKYVDLANRSGISDRFEIIGENGRYLADGIHPNDAGGQRIAECIYDETRFWTWNFAKPIATITLRNILDNANFEDVGNWRTRIGLGTGGSLTVFDNVATILIGSSYSNTQFSLQQDVEYVEGHIYYLRMSAKSEVMDLDFTGSDGWFALQVMAGGSIGQTSVHSADWRTWSGLHTALSTSILLAHTIYMPGMSAALRSKTAQYREAMAIDLTAAFGAGNEPSKSWCDTLDFFIEEKQIVL